ncbi:2,4-dienoyl-CoA reductase-like NADH-dependent reductase (Old Yellow Enzyme family) [Paraburkholderia sp. BL18I3N2]|uniref:oxidoreductase n=1 Tax=Paraburkholderia sp. BL18I3N2 TaxID=1938799 RepID=UPI000D07B182|nr:FAD-dependent oxidoreductase [Paraburkholderia sp. BL18I3N2]PRX27342.1 2,4-dienoyl-CoA reductase-like NADH-dependent reductase (Old Yellow Enzyme family) [Paraburkholderia sp. BL18I3N2]
MSTSFANLLAPGRIGSMQLRNRIFMSPMGSNLAEPDGFCGERLAQYYAARAKGGAAMVIMGSVGVAYPRGSGNQMQVAISDDKFIPGLARVAEAVHEHGCKIAVQLQHAGAIAVNEPLRGLPLLVPSIPTPKDFDWAADLTPQENKDMFEVFFQPGVKIEYQAASEEDIEWVIDCFARAAVRAKQAGIDGVEIHAGHGYLLSSFLSPSSNKRTDRWGGTLENRARLLVETVKRIRAAVGLDYPVWFRIDGIEHLKNDGITLEDAIEATKLGVAAGADAVHVTMYADASKGISFTEAHTVQQPCKYVPYASAIKANVDVPVITVGRVEPEQADAFIAQGKFDFLAMARKLLADDELPNKLKAGRPDLIRPCIYCYTCISQIFLGTHTRCAVNAKTGFEITTAIEASPVSKKVLVIGGGPAGMEVARVAALRGHKVHLYESSDRLGGTAFFSSIVYPENGKLIDYLKAQLHELKIDYSLRTKVTPKIAAKLKPDTIVVATGARRAAVKVPGYELPHVLSGDELREMVTGRMGTSLKKKLNLRWRLMIRTGKSMGLLNNNRVINRLSERFLPLGEHVLVYGGGLVGVEVAEFLAERHRKVTLIEPGPSFGKELMMVRRWRIMDSLRKLGVRMLKESELTLIKPGKATYRTSNGQLQTIRADTVIMALGAEPSGAEITEKLKEICGEVHCVGDANELGYIEGAMRNGNRVAREI